jgi:tetratricopeptide (TPR) repeat protein
MIAMALIAALSFPAPLLAASAKGKKEAAKLARKAKRHYQQSQFLEAAQLFQKAYELSKVPSQLRNAAKSFEKAEALEKALSAWEQYKALRISRDEQLEAEAHIDLIHEKKRKAQVEKAVDAARLAAERAQLEARAAKEAVVEASRAPPPVAPPPPALVLETSPKEEKGPVIFPWVVVGTGLALGIVSAVLWFVAQADYEDFTKRLAVRDGQGLVIGFNDIEEANDGFDSINTKRNASGALLGVAITAIVAGGIWATLDYTLD